MPTGDSEVQISVFHYFSASAVLAIFQNSGVSRANMGSGLAFKHFHGYVGLQDLTPVCIFDPCDSRFQNVFKVVY